MHNKSSVGPKPVVLVVDDEPAFTESLKLSLEHEGYAVQILHEGNEAIEKIAKINPDIILLDVMMPKLDGFHVCRMMKYNKKMSYIPIVMVTARSRQADRDLGLSVGADGYFVKPFEPEELFSQMEQLIKQSAVKKQQMLLEAEKDDKAPKKRVI